MMKIEKNKGITLVALVITIVVITILAGVAINSLSGDNGVIEGAKKEKSNKEGLVRNIEQQVNQLYNELQSMD